MKILSLGAALMDQVASVERFPEDDGEVFVPELRLLPGGSAANFAVLCARLGAEAGFAGKVGNDPLGEQLVADLRKEGVDVRGVSKSELPTGTAFIAVRKDGHRVIYAYSGAANDLSSRDLDLGHLNGFDHLHLADLDNLEPLEFAASNFKGTVSLNAGALIAGKGADAHGLAGKADILICSEDEAEKLTGKSDIGALYTLGPKMVVMTRGPEPPQAFLGSGIIEEPVVDVPVVDTTGAGDAFSAGFVCHYLKTKSVKESLRFANAAAAVVIQNRGARGGLESLEQVESLL